MSRYSFTMHITSNDSKHVFNENKPWLFHVVPPYALQFPGRWTCTVESLFCEVDESYSKPHYAAICCLTVLPPVLLMVCSLG